MNREQSMKLFSSAQYKRVTNGFFAFILAVSSVTAFGPFLFSQNASALAGPGTYVVSGNTAAGENQEGWMFGRDLGFQTPFSFSLGNASTGVGSIAVAPISGAVGSNKFIAENFVLSEIANIQSISYDYKLGAATNPNQVYMNVYMNFPESAMTKFYDCRYDVVQTVGSTSAFSTATFDLVNGNYSFAQRNTSPQTCPSNPAAMGAGAKIRAFAINVGDTSVSDASMSAFIDNARVVTNTGTLAYDFEPADTVRPTVELIGTGGATAFRSADTLQVQASDNAELNRVVANVRNSSGTIVLATQSPAAGANPYVHNVPLSSLGEGTYSLRYNATDVTGNVSLTSNFAFTIDNTRPTGTLVAPAEGALVGGAFTASGTAADTGTGVDRIEYRVNEITALGGTFVRNAASGTATGTNSFSFDVSGLTSGFYRVRAQIFDAAGNFRYVYNDVVVDADLPVIEFTGATPAAGSFVRGTVTVETTITDANPGPYDLSVENGAPTPLSLALTNVVLPTTGVANSYSWNTRTGGKAVADGQHTLSATTVDQAGNRSTITRQLTVDNTRPQVTLTAPTSGEFNPTGITLDGVDALGLDRLTANIYDESNTTLIRSCSSFVSPALTGTLNCSVAGLGEATYTIRANARDRAGNISTTITLPFTIDTTAPVVALTSPVDAATVNDPGVLIEGSTGDAVSYELFIDGISVGADTSAFSSYNWDTTLYASGSYVIELVAEDAAGNSSSDSITVTLEGDPQVAINGSTATTATPTVTGTIDDPDATLALTVDGGSPIAIDNDGSGTWSYTFPALANGTYDLEVTATDLAGNTSVATAVLEVTVPAPVTIVEGTDTTPATPLAVITPAIAAPTPVTAAVLGDTTADPAAQSGEADVEGVSTVAQAADTDTTDGSLFGLAWYWWVLIAAAVAAFLAWLIAVLRRRNQEA